MQNTFKGASFNWQCNLPETFKNTWLVSSGVSLTSWGEGASLAFNHTTKQIDNNRPNQPNKSLLVESHT